MEKGLISKNVISVDEDKSLLKDLIKQLQDPLIYILIAAAIISITLGELGDAIIILAVIFIDAMIGLFQEIKAKKSLKALENLAAPYAVVIREGEKKSIKAEDVVVGDKLCFEAGDMIAADIKITKAIGLFISEATLTGESMPVEKAIGNEAFMSSLVTLGSGEGIVTHIGMDTVLGKVAAISAKTKQDKLTPLQKRLEEMGKLLGIFSVLVCILLVLIGLLQHRNPVTLLLVAISLAVAAVPEGLLAVVTICMAVGVTKMAEKKSIVRRLSAVETLGCVDVVCSDKTGTLTLNKMVVVDVYGDCSDIFYKAMILCNKSELKKDIGDPTEIALLQYTLDLGIDIDNCRRDNFVTQELPFDSNRKLMTVITNSGMSYTKGAPDVVLKKCAYYLEDGCIKKLDGVVRRKNEEKLQEYAQKAFRNLGFSVKYDTLQDPEENMIWLGMVALEDPVRVEAVDAIDKLKTAGVSIIMITGDHELTARAYGERLNVCDEKQNILCGSNLEKLTDSELEQQIEAIRVFARVSPTQKLRVIKALKARGHIVAMTGDGVNDAPALKAADVGIAMGKKGTQVAKQASDIILVDDNFATIEAAMEEGRSIYENIKKTVLFLLSSNLGEILMMFVTVLLGLPTPLKSGHILWINLITDSLPALALGMDSNDGKDLMNKRPRKQSESLFANGGVFGIIFYGIVIGAVSLMAYLFPLYFTTGTEDVVKQCQTYAFSVLGITQLFHAIGMRNVDKSIFKVNHLSNQLMIIAVLLGIILQIALTRIKLFVDLFGVVTLGYREWIVIIILSAIPLVAHEILVIIKNKI